MLGELETLVSLEPTTETRNRKRLRPNELAEWEIRIGDFRVFCDFDQENKLVKIEAVGYKKRSQLFIRGKEYKL
ncbi:MAG: plasmid stabilization protein ParE [Acidobacteria bacterium]|nr:MAG: plasmid stabilization protein ParE [Acidobacteriota bacterium]